MKGSTDSGSFWVCGVNNFAGGKCTCSPVEDKIVFLFAISVCPFLEKTDAKFVIILYCIYFPLAVPR